MAGFHQLSLTDFVNSCLKIQNYCRSSKNEKCGITTNVKTHIVKNCSQDKKNFFYIDAIEYYKIYSEEIVQFIWHSHPVGDASPSYIDIDVSNEHQYNSIIFSKENKNFSLYRFDLQSAVYFSL